MSLYKRGGVWWTYIWQDGVRHGKSTGTGDRKLAKRVEDEFREELILSRLGMSQLTPEMPVGELAARFLAGGSPKPFHIDRLKPLLPFWSETPIGRITKSQAREYRQHRHKQNPKLSDVTINRDLEVLRHILFWAVDEGFLKMNPLSRCPMVRPRRKPRVILSLTEEEKLLAAAAPHLRDIAIASLDAGLRRGEILAQRWEHIDFDRRLLSVTHSKTAGGEAREIPLTDRLFGLLNGRREAEGFVFTFQGDPIIRIKTAWKSAIRRAGIRYLRFHDLRHTFNTRLLEAGVLQEVRKKLMGHSSGEEVNAIYTHIDVLEKRKAIRNLELWVAAQREESRKEKEGGEHEETGASETAQASAKEADHRATAQAVAATGRAIPLPRLGFSSVSRAGQALTRLDKPNVEPTERAEEPAQQIYNLTMPPPKGGDDGNAARRSDQPSDCEPCGSDPGRGDRELPASSRPSPQSRSHCRYRRAGRRG